MACIYLSPHLDDAVFSCGGLIWEQAQAGEAPQIWTLCAGDPPAGDLPPFAQSLHARWGTGVETVAQRREEDQAAGARVGAQLRWFEAPDCIYRRDPESGEPIYGSGAAIFGALHPADAALQDQFTRQLTEQLPKDANVVVPLTVGNHVDHQLVRRAAEGLERPLHFYADFPYVIDSQHLVGYLLPTGARGEVHAVSPAGLAAWKEAMACYSSQLSSFWPDREHMDRAVEAYSQRAGGLEIFSA